MQLGGGGGVGVGCLKLVVLYTPPPLNAILCNDLTEH